MQPARALSPAPVRGRPAAKPGKRSSFAAVFSFCKRRGFLGHWGYDTNIDVGEGARKAQFEDFITDDYKTVLSNMIADMIPEPGTVGLLALGGLAALLRRRRGA